MTQNVNPWIVNQPSPVTSGPYGHDLSCVTDLDPAMAETDGVHCLTQAITRRLITPRGGLIDDPNYGTDLTAEMNNDLLPSDIGRLQSAINAECRKAERVFSAACTVVLAAQGVLTVSLVITGAAGPTFRMVLAITSVTVTVLSVSQ